MNKLQRYAYAAAFIDGEGIISLRKQRKYKGGPFRQFPYVEAFNTDQGPLEFLKNYWGGYISKNGKASAKRRQGYAWGVQKEAAREFLRQIEPYLIIKKEQARLALSFPVGKTGHRLTPSQIYEKERIYRQMAMLNKRGRRAEQLRMELKERLDQLRLL